MAKKQTTEQLTATALNGNSNGNGKKKTTKKKATKKKATKKKARRKVSCHTELADAVKVIKRTRILLADADTKVASKRK